MEKLHKKIIRKEEITKLREEADREREREREREITGSGEGEGEVGGEVAKNNEEDRRRRWAEEMCAPMSK